ncbi:hypothetical protein [Ancylobacter radicis]|uniref:Uncharacterized protein n=1 Tax=Ancylobacter radicis TaxID=2836179 RepID=A0ABS5RCG9_9HYPH|nr:hypothetical protein [Ancylobacter radicis]MBS9479000.1 hypothetical protein [Ancylobacter radicis]
MRPRVAADLAKAAGLAYEPSRRHQDISGRFAVLEDGFGFQRVPGQPVFDKQIGRQRGGGCEILARSARAF